MKDNFKQSIKEAKGLLVTGVQLATIIVPITMSLPKLPELALVEIFAIAQLVLGVGMGIYWLTRK